MPFYSFEYMGDSCTCDVGPPDEEELRPEARPRIICDNGPQFIAKDFKEFIRISGMTHVRTSPFYPQSNGRIERWHKLTQGRVHPAGNAPVAGRCAASDRGLRRALQQRPPEQRGWLHHTERRPGGAAGGDSTPTGIEVGSRVGNNGRFVDFRLREKSQRRYIPFCRGT
jgi:hypothetical protein